METRGILGASPQAQSLQKLVEQAAVTPVPVLISGERGTGRQFVAGLLHAGGPGVGSFEKLVCGGLSDALLVSELSRCIERAGDGTVFLDEINELPRAAQAELRRHLERKGMVPRILGSSLRNLEESVDSGWFSRDLYRLLMGIRITMPPLRERKTDIPVLADHFLSHYPAKSGKTIRSISGPALRKLMTYSWPGNVRELKDAVHRAATASRDPSLVVEDFSFLLSSAEDRPLQFLIPGASIQEIEKEAILRTLEHFGGSTTAAARVLNMSVRKVQYKLKQYRKAEHAETRARAQGAGTGS